MITTWEILCNELKCYGTDVISESECSFLYQGRKFKSNFNSRISLLKKQYNKNNKIIENLFIDILGFLKSCDNSPQKVYDQKLLNIFINSVIDLFHLSHLLSNSYEEYHDFMYKRNITKQIREILDRDYLSFSSDCIKYIPNYKIALDWVYRKNCQIEHMADILMALCLGKSKVNKIFIEARGVQGPWGNLDLPMKERVFSWDEISGETYGRDKDKRKQQRYEMGLDVYNKTGKVGEGFYWREHRNEPFSWSNRFTDSPYAQLRPGTWR